MITVRHSEIRQGTVSGFEGQREQTSGYDVKVNMSYPRIESLNAVKGVYCGSPSWYRSRDQSARRPIQGLYENLLRPTAKYNN